MRITPIYTLRTSVSSVYITVKFFFTFKFGFLKDYPYLWVIVKQKKQLNNELRNYLCETIH